MAMESHSRVGAGVGKCFWKVFNGEKCSHQSPLERGNKVQGEGASEASSSTYASKVSMALRWKCRDGKGDFRGSKSMAKLGFTRGKSMGKSSSNYVCVGGRNY